MIDIEIVRALSQRDNFVKYKRFIKQEALSREAFEILDWYGEWFKLHKDSQVIDYKSFAPYVLVSKLGGSKPERLEIIKQWLNELNNDADEDTVATVIRSLATRYHANEIASKALAVVDGKEDTLEQIESQLSKYHQDCCKVEDDDDYIVSDDILEMLAEAKASGYKWRLNALNESLGDLRQGDLVVVATRPDTGKTTFLASESTFIAEQMPKEKVVLWLNNEEAGKKVKRRIVQSALAITTRTMFEKPEKVRDVWAEKMGRPDKFILFDKADVSVYDVENLFEKYDVGLIVFDQLWKVHGFEKEAGNEVTRQTMIFNWARELAKKYAPVITVHQADGSAEGVKWIDMSKLYGSKTGVQGEADAIITIGRLPEEGNKRYLYVPKNKLDGNNQAFRNGRFEIEIQPEIGRFKE
jgi:replicative DNA helicase